MCCFASYELNYNHAEHVLMPWHVYDYAEYVLSHALVWLIWQCIG